jgi:hypothetical protein
MNNTLLSWRTLARELANQRGLSKRHHWDRNPTHGQMVGFYINGYRRIISIISRLYRTGNRYQDNHRKKRHHLHSFTQFASRGGIKYNPLNRGHAKSSQRNRELTGKRRFDSAPISMRKIVSKEKRSVEHQQNGCGILFEWDGKQWRVQASEKIAERFLKIFSRLLFVFLLSLHPAASNFISGLIKAHWPHP